MYSKVESVREAGTRSPVVFLHGFPDSPLMYRAYITEAEQQEAWLRDRPIYTVAFPNRFTNPNYPPLSALIREPLQAEVAAILQERMAASPTGRIVIIAHDWGATYSWAFIRAFPHLHKNIEAMVALSVASSFRFDIWEHGLNALAWMYSTLFGLPYYMRIQPVQRAVASTIAQSAGYSSDHANTLYLDTYYYWYGPLRPFLLPFDLLGIRAHSAYLDFTFPVLFIRSEVDKLPSTKAFEQAMLERENCRLVILDGVNHWFPEQHPQRVLAEFRTFLVG